MISLNNAYHRDAEAQMDFNIIIHTISRETIYPLTLVLNGSNQILYPRNP
jgi:hypothetical protein